jgi:hypothetical protein
MTTSLAAVEADQPAARRSASQRRRRSCRSPWRELAPQRGNLQELRAVAATSPRSVNRADARLTTPHLGASPAGSVVPKKVKRAASWREAQRAAVFQQCVVSSRSVLLP